MDASAKEPRTVEALLEFGPADGEPTLADLLTIGSQSIGIARYMPGVVMPVVVDANVLIEDLLRVADGKRSSLLIAATLGSARPYTTDAVIDEVEEHLPDVACSTARDVAPLLATLRRSYFPHLRLVDVSDVHDEDERVRSLELEDPDDVDAAKLAILLSPSFLLTADGDHLRHGLGVIYEPHEKRSGWTFGAVALHDRGLTIGLMAGGQGGVMAAWGAGSLVIGAGKSVARNEKLVMAGFVVLVAIAILLAVSPRVHERAASLANTLADGAKDVADALATGVGTAMAWSEDARQMFEANATRRLVPDTDFERVARTLAVARAGVSVVQLQEALVDVPNLESVLHSSRVFVEVLPGRWALGRSAQTSRRALPGGANDSRQPV